MYYTYILSMYKINCIINNCIVGGVLIKYDAWDIIVDFHPHMQPMKIQHK